MQEGQVQVPMLAHGVQEGQQEQCSKNHSRVLAGSVMALSWECEGVWWSGENVNLGNSPWFKISGKHWAGRLKIHLWGFVLQKEKQHQTFTETSVLKKKREQLSYQTLTEITAVRNNPEWILMAFWFGSFSLCTYRHFPFYLCTGKADTTKCKITPNYKPSNLSEGDEKCYKVIEHVFCCN